MGADEVVILEQNHIAEGNKYGKVRGIRTSPDLATLGHPPQRGGLWASNSNLSLERITSPEKVGLICMDKNTPPVGRFAPTPSGRMHLGNVFAAMIAWLSVRSRGGSLVLRMEDLDTQRTSEEYAALLRGDLKWLGLDWDEETPPQSQRSATYDRYFEQLRDLGLLYPCYCTRSQLHNVNAPHLSDGTYVYAGTCRNLANPPAGRAPSWRVRVPDKEYSLTDLAQGEFRQNLTTDCGDFVVRRADGVYVYQLAVTVDDGEAGVTEVVRGMDLLGSAPRQMYLQELFGFAHPAYGHVPMLLAADGRRLSKRDRDLDLGELQKRMSAQQLLGQLAFAAGLLERYEPVSAKELATVFSWDRLQQEAITIDTNNSCFFP